jgi:hypothetical protein
MIRPFQTSRRDTDIQTLWIQVTYRGYFSTGGKLDGALGGRFGKKAGLTAQHIDTWTEQLGKEMVKFQIPPTIQLF